MQAGTGVKHHITGSELDAMFTKQIHNNQLPALVILRLFKKECAGQITADTEISAREAADTVINMKAEFIPA